MHDLKFLRDHLDAAEARLATRGAAHSLAALRELDARRRELLGENEALKAERNTVSALIGRSKDKSQLQAEIDRMKTVSTRIKELDEALRQVDDALRDQLLVIPNLPDPVCPVGSSEADNPEVRRWGTPRAFAFEPQPHWELGEALGILDFERAAKLAGARFAVGFKAGARLERALINFMLDRHTAGDRYLEVLPPLLVNRDTMTGTGREGCGSARQSAQGRLTRSPRPPCPRGSARAEARLPRLRSPGLYRGVDRVALRRGTTVPALRGRDGSRTPRIRSPAGCPAPEPTRRPGAPAGGGGAAARRATGGAAA